LSFTAEDLARSALLRILPRHGYRLAGQTDSRFSAFAANCVRIAYRQHGARPGFLLFTSGEQDALAAAREAAAWAAQNWRPNRIQKKVAPGVVVVQVGHAAQLVRSGQVAGTAVPSAVWTVDVETGRSATDGRPPGAPAPAEIRRAAAALVSGVPAPSLGELDLAEREMLRPRSISMPPLLTGAISICLLLFALRYGAAAFFGAIAWSGLISAGAVSGLALAGLTADALLLAGIVLGVGILFNVRNLAYRTPGFSSWSPGVRTATWAGFFALMVGLVIVTDVVLPSLSRSTTAAAARSQLMQVTATVDDDGSESALAVGGTLSVDLSGWPKSEWSGVRFTTSNPSVLSLDATPAGDAAPVARFGGRAVGAARVDAASADGRYSYQLRVSVVSDSGG
jgi:hypothetical protein